MFISWETQNPHKEDDQWLLYINEKTKFADLANITIRDFFLPFPPNMVEGTIRYHDRVKTSEGIYFPSNGDLTHVSKKREKHIYRITFRDYKFNVFPEKELQPFKELTDYGDSKPKVIK